MDNSHKKKIFMRKGNIFVLTEIEKTTIKSLMLNPCPHNYFSLTFKNSTISQNSHLHDHTSFPPTLRKIPAT